MMLAQEIKCLWREQKDPPPLLDPPFHPPPQHFAAHPPPPPMVHEAGPRFAPYACGPGRNPYDVDRASY